MLAAGAVWIGPRTDPVFRASERGRCGWVPVIGCVSSAPSTGLVDLARAMEPKAKVGSNEPAAEMAFCPEPTSEHVEDEMTETATPNRRATTTARQTKRL